MQMLAYPCDDTEYDAEALGLDKAVRSRGVIAAGDCLSLAAAGGMAVTLSPGICNLKMDEYWGVTARLKAACTFTLDASDGVLSRYDIVRARLDKTAQTVECEVLKGTPSSAPSIPAAPQRDANADEIYLHAVYVGAGALEITAANITDLRLNTAVCGLVRDGIERIPTEQLAAQAESMITQTRTRADGQLDQLAEELAIVHEGGLYGVVVNDTAALPASGWSAAAPYTQTVTAAKMAELYEPFADVVLSGTAAQKAAQGLEWNKISWITAGSGTITATCCRAAPTIDLAVNLWVIV